MKKFPRVAVIQRVVEQMIEASELEAVEGGALDFDNMVRPMYGAPTPEPRVEPEPRVKRDPSWGPVAMYGGPTIFALEDKEPAT